jgi:hypothetical protein
MSSPEVALETMIRNLKEKTGKSLDDWIKIARNTKLSKHKELLTLLKSEHRLGHGYANLITLKALQSDAGSANDDDLIAAQYSGPKAALKPAYDALIAAVEKFGSDVEIAPKKAYVSLRRKKQFGILQPSTATRLDVGINLKGKAPTSRLEPSGSFNAMVSHRVRLSGRDDIDKELLGWLRQAYDQA